MKPVNVGQVVSIGNRTTTYALQCTNSGIFNPMSNRINNIYTSIKNSLKHKTSNFEDAWINL
jgi:hypothetical protein